MGTAEFFPGGKVAGGFKVDHSHPPTATPIFEVKNAWMYTYMPFAPLPFQMSI
jgi:hypothetical protein